MTPNDTPNTVSLKDLAAILARRRWQILITFFLILVFVPALFAQPPQRTPGYILGPDDQILIRAPETGDMFEKPVLIGTNGNITLPLIGRIQAAGLTVEQLEAGLNQRLKKFLHDPQVSVTVVEFQSQPVSVFGAVTTPGVIQLRGRKTLYEVLSMAGGPRETAGSTVTVTRRLENGEVPLPGASTDPTGRFSTAEVSVQEIVEGKNPAANIDIKPNDVVSVSQGNARMVYVVGDVQRAGAFALGGQRTVSVLGALSMAGGLGRTANSDKARIFREVPGQTEPQQIAVNITRIMAGKAENIGLRPQDVLVIPTSGRKSFTTYVVPAVIAAGVAAAIYAAIY
jgi:polysaccharide biosynthesis/export protein